MLNLETAADQAYKVVVVLESTAADQSYTVVVVLETAVDQSYTAVVGTVMFPLRDKSFIQSIPIRRYLYTVTLLAQIDNNRRYLASDWP